MPPSVTLSNWLIQSVAYDGTQRILELEMNTGERFQHVGVPRRVAIALVQADDPAKYMNECIEGTYRFRRVRLQRRERE
jgi:KTSC domain-containing protein